MPFNLLLLPLLAGYLFLSRSRLRSYATSQFPKDQLLLLAAVYGFLFLLISRAVSFTLLQSEVGISLAHRLHQFAPFSFIGTAVGTLVLAWLLIGFSNAFVSEKAAGFWLYHRGALDPLTRMLWSSVVGVASERPRGEFRFTIPVAARMTRYAWKALGPKRLFTATTLKEFPGLFRELRESGVELSGLPQGKARTVIIHLKDGKVITGWVLDIPTDRPSIEFVTVSPLWTGYRDDNNRVLKTIDYSSAVQELAKNGSNLDSRSFARVVRTADITSVSLFNETAFKIPMAPEAESVPARGASAD